MCHFSQMSLPGFVLEPQEHPVFIPLTDNRKSKIYKGKQFNLEFGCIKIQYEHRQLDRTGVFIFSLKTFFFFFYV